MQQSKQLEEYTTEELLIEKSKRLCSKSFSEFTKQSWHITEPCTEYMHNWHIDLISEYLTACREGQIKRLLINIPPRHMKSILGTVNFPCWVWTSQPEKKFITLSYSIDLSTKHSLDRRTIIQSEWYKKRFGVELSEDQNLKTQYKNTKMGQMLSTSIFGTIVGEGADCIIVDDPLNPRQAASDIERESATNVFRNTLYTRLNNKKTGVIIVIMQRLHENDVSGYLLESGGWEHLKIPAVNEVRTTYHSPVSNTDITREPGQLIWEEREDQTIIDSMKINMGSYTFSGQYQQEPAPTEGGMIKRHWFNYYDKTPEHFDEMLQSWDLTFKDSIGSDFVCGQVWGRKGSKLYLIDVVRARMDFVNTIRAIENLSKKYPRAVTKLMEEKANGAAVLSMLRNKIFGFIPINPKESKTARLSAVSPLIEAGNVYVPSFMPWLDDFVNEMCTFPNAKFDDMVDACTQALSRFAYLGVKPVTEKEPSIYNFDCEKPDEDSNVFGGEIHSSYINYGCN